MADERYRILFEHSSDAHLIVDDNAIIDCNQAAVDDGVPEAMDSELEPLGDEAILEVLRSNTGSVASSVERLDIAAVDWCGDSRLKDNISIIAFERGTGKGS